jgi:hypothetical protein
MVGVILPTLAAVFLLFAGYDTFRLMTTNLNQRLFDKKQIAAESSEDLARLQSNERAVRSARERQALQANPLDHGPLYNLAALARVDGKSKLAEELILLAADRSLRDPRVLGQALPIFLRRRDFAGALYRIDGLARSKAEFLPQLLPVMAGLAETKEGISALVDVLAQDPPWRAQAVGHLSRERRPAIAYRLLSGLRTTAAPPTMDEVRALLSGFIENRDYETAYFVWLDFLTDEELRKVSHIFDGGFDLEPKNLFFDWTYVPIRNVDLRILPRNETNAADRILSIDFLNPRTRFANLWQLLRLSPGSYLFAGDVKAEYEQINGGLVWRLYCIGDKDQLVAQTSRSQAQGWARFELSLEIPASGCDTQRIQLELDTRAVLDHQIKGRVSYDNLTITPQD